MRKMVFVHLLFLCFAQMACATSCETITSCAIGTTCACTIPADSAFDRYYYTQITTSKNHVYECKMASGGGVAMIVVNAKLPDGVRASCPGSCQRFPIDMVFDARDQTKDEDNIIIKYFIPGSDMPTPYQVLCESIF